jgi:hypothetical protein
MPLFAGMHGSFVNMLTPDIEWLRVAGTVVLPASRARIYRNALLSLSVAGRFD